MNGEDRLREIGTNAKMLRDEISNYFNDEYDFIDWKTVRILILKMYELAFFPDELLGNFDADDD